jgi:hypothetical protein
MPFVNEFISPQDFKKYDIEGVFKKVVGSVTYVPPFGWTIDRARNIFLLYLDTGTIEGSNPLTFALWWDGAVIVIDLEMPERSRSDRYIGVALWGLCRLHCPKDFPVAREEVIRVLKEAMIGRDSRGAFGHIDSYSVEFNF